MAATAPLDPRLARVDGRLCWRLGDRIVPLIAGGDDGDPATRPRRRPGEHERHADGRRAHRHDDRRLRSPRGCA